MGESADSEKDDPEARARNAAQERLEREVAAFDKVIARYLDAGDPALQVATAMVRKGLALGAMERFAEEVGVYDDVVARYWDASELAVRVQVAKALVSKGFRLWGLDRAEDAVSVYDEVLARFGDATEPALLEQVAKALNGKGVALGRLKRFHDAVLAFDEILHRFAGATESALRAMVSNALINETMALTSLPPEDKWEVPDEVKQRLDAATAAARSARPVVMRAPIDYLCPVCGYPMDDPPWDRGTGSQEICPSCGIQFGYHDARVDLHPQIYPERRERWVTGGIKWSSPEPEPAGWDPQWQLLALVAQGSDEHKTGGGHDGDGGVDPRS